ncbi:MAG: hypothetical protein HQK65_00285 [Desulfamplus sp.]|nr:hypothetical protein [Desulfamplus sp.]
MIHRVIKDIYPEHLEEASFLYEQRLGLINDPEITWKDIKEFEGRCEAHIDALVIGGSIALQMCFLQMAKNKDAGEFYTVICLLCRQRHMMDLKKLLEESDCDDKDLCMAVVHALRDELPKSCATQFVRMMLQKPSLVAVMATVAGYRRLPVEQDLLKILEQKKSDAIPDIIRALGRLPKKQSIIALLYQYLLHEDDKIRYETALALLRMGERKVLDRCIEHSAESEMWSTMLIGIGAGKEDVSSLLNRLKDEKVNDDCFIALGLLGNLIAIEEIILHFQKNIELNTPAEEIISDSKKKPELNPSAALALHLITGADADLYEEVFVPDRIDDDELFDDELKKRNSGEPVYEEGLKPGSFITRLTLDPEKWWNWWQGKKDESTFDCHLRYRYGKLFSPACLIESLKNEKTPHLIRQMAYEELVVRYGMDFHFEADMPVADQEIALEELEVNGSAFDVGRWYFGKEVI